MSETLRVRLLRKCQDDLVEIDRYLEREAPARHGPVIERLLGAIERLGAVPKMGPVASDARLRDLGFRYLSVDDYLIFYKVVGREVRVYRALHECRAYWRLLR